MNASIRNLIKLIIMRDLNFTCNIIRAKDREGYEIALWYRQTIEVQRKESPAKDSCPEDRTNSPSIYLIIIRL